MILTRMMSRDGGEEKKGVHIRKYREEKLLALGWC